MSIADKLAAIEAQRKRLVKEADAKGICVDCEEPLDADGCCQWCDDMGAWVASQG